MSAARTVPVHRLSLDDVYAMVEPGEAITPPVDAPPVDLTALLDG